MATTKATKLAHTIASTTSSTADLDYAKTLNNTGVTSTEFDKLDGLTATTDELNLVDGSVSGPLSHRNLIINGDFRINQRSATSRTQTSSEYNYDRWYYDGTYLYQGVEDKNVRNGTFTLSWTDSGSDITAHYVVSTDSSNNNGPDSPLTYTSVSNGGQITVNEGTEYSKHLWIRFGGTVANLSKVQLEEGSVATPFEHRSYGEELELCMRYYQSHQNPPLCGVAQTSTRVRVSAGLPLVMRTSPSSTLTNTGLGLMKFYDGDTNKNVTGIVSNYTTAYKMSYLLSVNSSLAQYRPVLCDDGSSAKSLVELEAEL